MEGESTELQRVGTQLKNAADGLVNAMRVNAQEVQRVQRMWAYARAKWLYREHVGPLPGSEGTKRLRKKRFNRVMTWYLREWK